MFRRQNSFARVVSSRMATCLEIKVKICSFFSVSVHFRRTRSPDSEDNNNVGSVHREDRWYRYSKDVQKRLRPPADSDKHNDGSWVGDGSRATVFRIVLPDARGDSERCTREGSAVLWAWIHERFPVDRQESTRLRIDRSTPWKIVRNTRWGGGNGVINY